MTPVMLEHANITVSNPQATAAWMCDLFGWHIRWEGPAKDGGQTIHVGSDTQYVAVYAPAEPPHESTQSSYSAVGGLNHLAVVVDDIDLMEQTVLAHGFKTGNHANYEPGQRFYFHDADGIEYEVVQYD